MKYLIIMLALFINPAAASDDSYIRVLLGAGFNTNTTGGVDWIDGGGTGGRLEVGYTARLWNNPSYETWVDVAWVHLSQWEIGPPLNNKLESAVDHFGVAFEWRWH